MRIKSCITIALVIQVLLRSMQQDYLDSEG